MIFKVQFPCKQINSVKNCYFSSFVSETSFYLAFLSKVGIYPFPLNKIRQPLKRYLNSNLISIFWGFPPEVRSTSQWSLIGMSPIWRRATDPIRWISGDFRASIFLHLLKIKCTKMPKNNNFVANCPLLLAQQSGALRRGTYPST